MIRMALKVAGEPEREITCCSELLTIGRAPSNSVVVGRNHVSWQHAQISFRMGHYWYRDLHSTNGSFVLRGDQCITLGRRVLEERLCVDDTVLLGSEDTAIQVTEIVEDIIVVGDFGKTILVGEQVETIALHASLAEDNAALRCLVNLAGELAEIRNADGVKRHIARVSLEAFSRAERTVIFDARGDDFEPATFAPAAPTLSANGAIAKSVTLLRKVAEERRGLVYVIYEDAIRAFASHVHNLAMRESAMSFVNKALLCCPLIYGDGFYGVIQIESGRRTKPEETFTRRDLALATMLAQLAAARLHDLEHHEQQMKLQRKATVSIITSWLAHDLRNLLQLPMSLASMIPILLRADPEGQLEHILFRNRACVEFMNLILTDITDVSKDQSADFRECDLPAQIGQAVEYLQKMNPEGLCIEVQADPRLPQVTCNPGAIQRLVLNLVHNAIDAIAESGRDEDGKIVVACRHAQDTDEIIIEVKDNGPGIPSDLREEMQFYYDRVRDSEGGLRDLEAFAETSRSHKMKKGKGLGFLFACQTVVAHRGTMDIQTGETGTTFTIRLPRFHPPAPAREDILETQLDDHPPDRTLHPEATRKVPISQLHPKPPEE